MHTMTLGVIVNWLELIKLTTVEILCSCTLNNKEIIKTHCMQMSLIGNI
jgi:hypothetical protein